MEDRIIIERLEFFGHCGVTQEERQTPQPVGVDLELTYPPSAFGRAAAQDDIALAVDYAKVADRIVQLGTAKPFALVETLAEQITTMVFAEFPVSDLRLWVRKLAPPLKDVRGSVGVKVERARTAAVPDPPPAPFLQEQLARLPKGTVLDLASGQGRNALYLAGLGYAVEAVDRDQQALTTLADTAGRRHLRNLTTRQMDLESDPVHPPDLGAERYDVILVFFDLHRPLFPALLRALKPGGLLIYETFLIDNHLRRQHPKRKEFCLAHNELLRLIGHLQVRHYDEGEHEGRHGQESAFTARLAAQRTP
ncbi:MAG: dihydroneopterin aldolase [Nitrospiraceae bacterium]